MHDHMATYICSNIGWPIKKPAELTGRLVHDDMFGPVRRAMLVKKCCCCWGVRWPRVRIERRSKQSDTPESVSDCQ
jgi:hypothetical protein